MEYIKTATNVVEGLRNFDGIDEKMEKLKRKFERLKSREEDVKEELKYAERLSLKKRRKVVENWLRNVGSIKNQVEQMEKEVGERSWFKHFPLEREMSKLTEQVRELDQQGRFPEGLTLEAHGNEQFELITPKLIGKKFQQHKDVIWECLTSDKVSKIGIYGMGGVGKTTLVAHIHNELLKRPNSNVSWVTVSQNCSIHKLQSDIANTIRLKLENDDDERKRAAELARGLRVMNNFVLILDDVWQFFPLDRVGIPTSGNGIIKLILTSRSLDVCRRIVCEEYIKVEPLPEKAAWELFTEKLGHGKILSREIEPFAESLIKKCSGLPLAIITMAGCMREVEDIAGWSDALEKMKESVALNDDDMGIEVFKVLKYSYDQLKDPIVQQCFLYCSLLPEDYEINRSWLIENFINERLVDGMRSRQAELNRGHTILNKLENVCLLEGITSGTLKSVKMHDLVRTMGIQIARLHFPWLVEAREILIEIPGEEKWTEDLTKVSLMHHNITRIPSGVSPKCPKLSTLLLNDNQKLSGIPDCFFSHMPALSVLDLSFTSIQNLPASISGLVNLTALWLEGCSRLECVPNLENLKALRRLNLSLTGIREVPQGLEMLLNLRYLNLDGTSLQMIPDGILPKLSRLECLIIQEFCGFTQKVRGEELVKLGKLEIFRGQLHSVHDFNTYARWREDNGGPNNYLLLLGRVSETFLNFIQGYERGVGLRGCKISENEAGEELLVLPTDVQFLHIEECNDASSLCGIVTSLKNATNKLTNYCIDSCSGMKHVICSSASCSLPHLQSIESLQLRNLLELSSFFGGEVCLCASASASASSSSSSSELLQTSMFSSLKKFEIINCPKIKRLFMPVLLLNFKHLEKLSVRKCKQMVVIIGEASDEDEDENQEPVSTSIISALPKLSYLELVDLPELKRFCTREIVFDSPKQIYIKECPKLSFNGQHAGSTPTPIPTPTPTQIERNYG